MVIAMRTSISRLDPYESVGVACIADLSALTVSCPLKPRRKRTRPTASHRKWTTATGDVGAALALAMDISTLAGPGGNGQQRVIAAGAGISRNGPLPTLSLTIGVADGRVLGDGQGLPQPGPVSSGPGLRQQIDSARKNAVVLTDMPPPEALAHVKRSPVWLAPNDHGA